MGKASRRKRESSPKSTPDSESATPWYEKNLFWAPITFAGGIVLTLIAAMKRDFRGWLFVAWLLTSISIWVFFRSFSSRSLKHSLQGGGMILTAVIFYAVYNWLTPAPPMPTPTAIFMECQMTGLPITILPRSKIHVVAINKKRMERENWGFFEIPNDTEKEKTWPENKLIDLSSKLKNFGVFSYECEVSNHGSENIIYLEIPIDIWFDNNKKAIRYAPIVSSLDVAQSFSFYVVNDCPINVSAAWQDSAKVQTLREPKTHAVPLRRKYRNPVEQIMMFFPSTVQWVREQPCE